MNPVAQARIRALWLSAPIPTLTVAMAFGLHALATVRAGHITGLTNAVEFRGTTLGEIRLHVGTHDFTPTGNEGIGRATPQGEQSGFYPDGPDLADAAGLADAHHFNWLQIVTDQPPGHAPTFGPVPHADPSNAPGNQTPHDLNPWYLNEGPGGTPPDPAINPPFDLPPLTASLLEFQDFPSGFNEGELISFDTYLVRIVEPDERTYTVLHGFTWQATFETPAGEQNPRLHVTELEKIDSILPQAYIDLVHDYGGMGWTLVPEPATAVMLVVIGLAIRATSRRSKQ